MQENVKERDEMQRKEASVDRTVWRKRLFAIAKEFLWGGAAYLLGGAAAPFDTTPFGIAFLCAAPRHLPSILIGLILSAFADLRRPLLYIIVYAVAALLRLISGLMIEDPDARFELPGGLRAKLYTGRRKKGKTDAAIPGKETVEAVSEKSTGRRRLTSFFNAIRALFTESLCLRLSISALCSMIVGVFRLIIGGFRIYDLFALIFSLLVIPLSVIVWSVWMEERRLSHWMLHLSRAAFGGVLILATNDLLLSGFSLAVILGTAFVLFAASEYGVKGGSIAAIYLGALHEPLYIPSFLLAALVFLLMQGSRRRELGSALAVLAMSVWALYAGGISSFLVYLPAGLIGAVSFAVFCRLRGAEEVTPEQKEQDGARLRMEGDKYKDSTERFRGISDAFSSLSEVFYNLSDRFRRPGTLDLRRICDGAFDEHCADCPNKTLCWGLEYSETLEAVNRLISRLHTHGKVDRSQVHIHLLKRCEKIDLILSCINQSCADLTGEMLRNNRTEIFAMDYEAASTIINDALEEDDGEYRFDEELERRIGEYLRDAGVSHKSVTVFGSRRRQILIRDVCVDAARVTVETVRCDLGEMCGLELSHPVFEVEGDVSTMILRAKQKISVTGAEHSLSAQGGISGDSLNLFSNKKDYFYALISDGMGSGREAAFTSKLCSVFLEKMLRAGNRASTSWRMLNNLICSRESDSTRECSSTIDLLEMDLMTGEASFIKSGASPSFILRGKVVHRLQVGTAPIGIIRSLPMQKASYSLRAGDTVVMVSDGILWEDEEGERFCTALMEMEGLSPKEMASRICRQATERGKHDDCSVIVLRIGEADAESA